MAEGIDMSKTTVSAKGLTKRFGKKDALSSIDFELKKGEFLAVLGPSGCGKTTLLRLIAGFIVPDEGIIKISERIVSGPSLFMPPEKRKVGVVFQDYALFPHMNVAKNIAFGLSGSSKSKQQVEKMLSLVGLKEAGIKMPHELSGGEQQRVAIARALAPAPDILLMDEPFSNLDADLRARVRFEIREILAKTNATVIFVTHDQEEALFIGDIVSVMNKGRIEQFAPPEEIFHKPANPFVAQFIGIADFLPGAASDHEIITEVGSFPIKQKLAQNDQLKVLFRPDYIDIRPAAEGKGVIADKVFQGMHYLYKVKLQSGDTIRCLKHHDVDYDLGTHVDITLKHHENVSWFKKEVFDSNRFNI